VTNTTGILTPPVTGRRWAGVGRSAEPDASRAGAAAARQALVGTDPKLVVVFSSVQYVLDELLAGVRQETGSVPVIGCSTAGEISPGRAGDTGVVMMALGGAGLSVATSAGQIEGDDLRRAGADAAACVERIGPAPHRVLLLLSDGLAGDQQEIVRGAYRVAGASVPLVGGCAGDGLQMRATYQFHEGDVLQRSVVGAAIASDAPMGIGVRHGWRRVGDAMLISGSDGCVVRTLNDEPALDVYLRLLGAPSEAHTDSVAFTRFALTHPLGLSRRSGEEVRFVAEANFDDRSIVCIAEVPQGGLTWFMEGDDASVLAATDAACYDALDSLGGQPPIGVLAFDCIARRGVLGDSGIQHEVARISEMASGAPVAGFYTYGEIARTHGVSGFHNQTLVVLALG
jgi:hypothetical protein